MTIEELAKRLDKVAIDCEGEIVVALNTGTKSITPERKARLENLRRILDATAALLRELAGWREEGKRFDEDPSLADEPYFNSPRELMAVSDRLLGECE